MSHPKNADYPVNTGSRLTEIADAGKKYSTSENSGVRAKSDYSHGTGDNTKQPVKLGIDLHTHEHDQKNLKHTHTSGLELASIHSKSLNDGTPESAKGLLSARAHSECKPQRRALVKQSTQGRFEIEEHKPTVSESPRKSPTGNSTDFSDKVQSKKIEKKSDLVSVSDKRPHTGSLTSPVKYDLSKFQHSAPHPEHGLTSHGAVPEEIPLKEIKLRLGNSAVDVTDYRQKFNERIRLKEKSRSVDNSDSYQSTQLSTGESVIDRLRSAGNKVLAVCSVHVSDSSAGNVKSVHLSPEAAGRRHFNAKTTKDQKQYLSPDSYPSMLEKSKSFHRIVNPNQIATEVKRLVHQSSAERKRLANQSSTETSGLGETVTSGFSSQESIHSYHSGARVGNIEQSLQDQGIDLCEDTRNIRHEGNSTFGTRIIDSDNTINHTNEPKKGIICMYSVDDVDTSGVDRPVVDTNSQSVASIGTCSKTSEKKVSGEKEMVNRQMTNRNIIGQSHLSSAYKPPLDFRSNDVKRPDNMPMFSANVGPDFDVLFTQSKNLKVPAQTVGLQLDQINNEWDKHKRGSSIKSRSSQGSFRSRSGSTRRSRRYLSHKESQWMKWGRERRMSLKKRVEKLDKPEPEIPRASTPVKKARQEGLMFVHPDLGSKYISEDDINYIRRHKQERLKTCKLIEKSKMKLHHEAHDINRLTPDELMTLSRFWEHRVFIRTRYVSILLSLVTTVIYVLSICSTQWVTYPSPEGKLFFFYFMYRLKPRKIRSRTDFSQESVFQEFRFSENVS